MSGQFIQRLINHVANEIIIKGLANSRTFQRFAVRTDHAYKEYSKQGVETFEKMAQEASKVASEATSSSGVGGAAAGSGPPQKPLTGIPGFFSAFAKEVRKDFS